MCEEYELLISRLLDDDLTIDEEAALREHMRSCPDCQRTFRAFSAVKESLRDDAVSPPESLAASVMERIGQYPAAPKRKNPWKKLLIAACLFAVIGIGGFAALQKTQNRASSAAYEMAVAESAVAAEEEFFIEEMPEPAPAAMEAGAGEAALRAGENSLDAEAAVYGADAAPALSDLYPIDAPALVPEGKETSFEALLTDARAEPPDAASVLCYVEYRGVIYEFSADGETLIWRDAAEGLPTVSLSPASSLIDLLSE